MAKRARGDGDERPAVTPRPAHAATWPVVMGVDPGTRHVGYGFLVVAPTGPRLLAAGVLSVGDRIPIAERLGKIGRGIDELIERFRPTVLTVESAFAARNVRSALRIGEGRGVVMACGGRYDLAVHEYAPAEVKRTVVGNGAASKEQVAALVARTLGAEDLGLALDASDALAIALTHVLRERAARITAGAHTAGGARGRRGIRGS